MESIIMPNQEEPSITLAKQIRIYLGSFFLPPLGLIWGIKYLKKDNQQIRKVGRIAIILTILSLALTIWTAVSFTNSFNQALLNQ
ncbi:MAG: hypothetical protein Q8Q24_00675, partial [bacterium]|nr:hypothetical protein [bacterium]